MKQERRGGKRERNKEVPTDEWISQKIKKSEVESC